MNNQLTKFQKQSVTVYNKNGQIIPNVPNSKKNNTTLIIVSAIIGFLIVFIPVQYDNYLTKQKIEKIKKEIEQNGRANRYAE
jgi:cell division protein FtsL